MGKEKKPLAELESIALSIYDGLKEHCDKIKICGSIRRRMPFVSDIEIVCVPKVTVVQEGLFAETTEKRSSKFIQTVQSLGTIEMGKPESGRYCKIMVGENQLDLFITNLSDYGRQVAIRTGSAEYSQRVIAYQWVRHGWVGTADGLRLKEECERENDSWVCPLKSPTLPPQFHTEQAFFEFIRVEWIEPENRR